MTIPTQWIHMFQRHRDACGTRAPAEQSAWLSPGAFEVETTTDEIRRYGFADEEKHNNLIQSGNRDVRLHKELCGALFRDLGYGKYLELDINDRADIVWDLNLPIPEDYHEHFALVYDGGTLEHIFNPHQDVTNMLRMTKLGGKIAHSQGIGDQVNHEYWTFNPSFLIDFYQANGCVLRELFILDLDGTEYPLDGISLGRGVAGYVTPGATCARACSSCGITSWLCLMDNPASGAARS